MGIAMLDLLALSVGIVALLAAAACDLAFRLIPNALPVLVALAGAGLRLSQGVSALLLGLLLAAGLGALLLLAWRRGLLGGGDLKLLVACALFLPAALLAPFLLATALAGGVIALVHLGLRPLLPARLGPAPRGAALPRRLLRAEAWRIRRGALPYAAAIAAGAIAALATEASPWA